MTPRTEDGDPPPGRTVPGNRWDLLDGIWPDAPPSVSVIVVHYRQQPQLTRTLAALARQSHPADRLEVIVVDDGSPELPEVPDGVTLLRQEDLGFRAAAARNLGARRARGDVLCFLDADTTPEPEYVQRLTRMPAIAPEAVTVARRAHADLSRARVTDPIEAVAPTVELQAPVWLQDGYRRSGNLLAADDRSYRYVISAVMACSRWFYDRVGGFDERFGEYGGEDWEWAYRAWLAGAVLAHVPDALAWHDGPDWSGRSAEDERRCAAKNCETLRLADAIPVVGSRGRAVRTGIGDVLAHVSGAPSAAAAYLCVDTLLVALPEATVVVPDAVAATFSGEPRVVASSGLATARLLRVRVVVHVERLVRVRTEGLRAAVDRIGSDALGSIELTDRDGLTLVRVASRRATARAERWGAEGLFPRLRERADWLEPVVAEPDLESYLGGWS